MHLKAIKSRLDRYAEIKGMDEYQLNKLEFDDHWAPVELMNLEAVLASMDLPALLSWVSRAARLLERSETIYVDTCNYSRAVMALLAELDDADIKGKGD